MAHSISRSLDIDPWCAKCGSELRLSCLEPVMNKPGLVHRIYECINCRSTQSLFISSEAGGH